MVWDAEYSSAASFKTVFSSWAIWKLLLLIKFSLSRQLIYTFALAENICKSLTFCIFAILYLLRHFLHLAFKYWCSHKGRNFDFWINSDNAIHSEYAQNYIQCFQIVCSVYIVLWIYNFWYHWLGVYLE